jgi:hypothetical protein
MDLLMTDSWFTPLLNLDNNNQEAISPYFEIIGFQSFTSGVNLGSTFLFLAIVSAIGFF